MPEDAGTPLGEAAALVAEIAAAHPAIVRLAEAVSLAVLVDPPLLRRARLKLVPEADAGVEAELWLGPLVRSRGPEGMVLAPEVAEALRERLRRDPERLARARAITGELHVHLSPAVRLEEEIAWLSVAPEEQAPARIEELLRSALAALVAGERRGLAGWAARALSHLPSAVRASPAAHMLAAGARLRLGADAGPLRARGDETGMPEWASWVAPADLPRVPVRVRLHDDSVELDAAPGATGVVLQLPATEPLLVDLTWESAGAASGDGGVQVTFRQGETRRIALPGPAVRLRTVLGEVYDLRPAGQPSGRLRGRIFDFTAERLRHRPFFGREHELRQLASAIDAAGRGGPRLIAVGGEAGEGKTALMARLIDQMETDGRPVAYHFFQRGRRSALIPEAARSLVAQLAGRFPEIEHRAHFASLSEVLDQLSSRPDLDRPILVLDGLDEVEEESDEVDQRSAWLGSLAATTVVASARHWGNITQRRVRWIHLSVLAATLERYWTHYWGHSTGSIDRAVELSRANFGIAALLNALLRTQDGRARRLLEEDWPPRLDVVEILVRDSEEKLGSLVCARWLGTLASARGPLPESLLTLVLGPDLPGPSASPSFESPLVRLAEVRDNERFYELRGEVAREGLGKRWRSLSDADALLAATLIPALQGGARETPVRDYALRNAVHHWLAASSALPTALDRASEICGNLSYLELKIETEGVAAARNEILNLLGLLLERDHDTPGDLDFIARVLSEERVRIRRHPKALGAILQSRLPADLPDLERQVRQSLGFPPGVPVLRPRLGQEFQDLWEITATRHRGRIVGCTVLGESFSAVISWSANGELKTWDLRSGDLMETFEGHRDEITGCVVLGRTRAVSSSRDGTLRVWDVGAAGATVEGEAEYLYPGWGGAAGRPVTTLAGHAGDVLGVADASDVKRQRVVSWSADQTLAIWQLEGPNVANRLFSLAGHDAAVSTCAVSLDRRYLVSGSADTTLRVWSLESGAPLCILRGHSAPVTGVVVLPHGRIAVSCSHDRTLKVWPLDAAALGSGASHDTLPELAPLESHQRHSLAILGCALSADGRWLVSWSLDRTAVIWDAEAFGRAPSPVVTRQLVGHQGAVLAAAFPAQAGRLVTCSADRTARVWDVQTGGAIAVLEGHTDEVRALAVGREPHVSGYSRNTANLIVSGGDDRVLRTWWADRPGLQYSMDAGKDEIILCLAAPDRGSVITGSRKGPAMVHREAGARDTLGIRPGTARGGAMSDEGLMATWRWDEEYQVANIDVWALDRRRHFATFTGHDGPVLACAFARRSESLLSASIDHSICAWRLRPDADDTGPIARAQEHDGPVSDLQVTSEIALSASWDATLRVWNLDLSRCLNVLTGHTDRVLACAIGQHGYLAVSASADRTLRLWDLGRRQLLAVLAGHEAAVTGCAFTRDSRRIVSRSLDSTLALWEAPSGRRIATLEGHEDVIHGLAVGDDVGLVYSCSEDETVRAWDLETGVPRGIFYGVSPIRSLAARRGGACAGDEMGNVWFFDATPYGDEAPPPQPPAAPEPGAQPTPKRSSVTKRPAPRSSRGRLQA
jgi:WD40 repeat protein